MQSDSAWSYLFSIPVGCIYQFTLSRSSHSTIEISHQLSLQCRDTRIINIGIGKMEIRKGKQKDEEIVEEFGRLLKKVIHCAKHLLQRLYIALFGF